MPIDYREIVENLKEDKVKQLLDSLGIPFQDTPTCLIMPTVCHHANIEEASNKLYYYKNTHIFYCYSEDGAMSIFKFLKNYYEVRNIEFDWERDILEVILNCSVQARPVVKNAYKSIKDNYMQKKNRMQLPEIPRGLLSIFEKYYPVEWTMDNISNKAMDKFNILYSPIQEKIIIPHEDPDGRLVGIRGRALNPWEIENVGKYMPVQIEGKWYSHPLSLNLYGLNKTKENIKKTGYAILVEAEKSVLQAESFIIPNCTAAVCGSKLNKYQLDLLMRYCNPKEIIIAFDKEELPGKTDYFQKLYDICQKYKNYCNFSFIYDKENLLRLKDSPTDEGENIFLELLRRRVKV